MTMKKLALTALAATLLLSACSPKYDLSIQEGPFEPSWESLEQGYRTPEWFRDAKLGLWSHWGLQCVPGWGDWYARKMYVQGDPFYEYHLKTYGHPSEYGFMEFIPQWTAENWHPDSLVALYKEAGAKYVVVMANHHDNFDNFDSRYQEWNSVNMGPHKDIVALFEQEARKQGLRFGISNHASHAWHWFQVAYGFDPEGPRAGERYDAWGLTKKDGKGKWWEGYDPQEFYGKPSFVAPDSLKTIREMNRWHAANDRKWWEDVPEELHDFAVNWFLRSKQLVDDYDPDLYYLDDETDLPMGQFGLDLAAHYYNTSVARRGSNEVVLTAKKLSPDKQKGVTFDCERSSIPEINPNPWQTCQCIGQWHYDYKLYENDGYKKAPEMIDSFIDIISKNGNLLLNIPLRGDGSLDDKEIEFLHEFGGWVRTNAEGIYASRPWKIFGEKLEEGGEVRFTTREGRLYTFTQGFPKTRTIKVRALGKDSAHVEGNVSGVSLIGSEAPVKWRQTGAFLEITVPAMTDDGKALCFAVDGVIK